MRNRKVTHPQPQNDKTDQPPKEQRRKTRNNNRETRKIALQIILYSIVCLYLIDVLVSCGVFYNMIKQFSGREEIRAQILGSLQSMSANLKTDPIMDIQMIDHGLACPSGSEPLKLGNWPGTIAGCLCENGDLHDKACNEVNPERCKINIRSTSPIDMFEWEDSLWCTKRAVLGRDYLKQIECPANYKECYPGDCFKGDCPITKLEITSTGVSANNFANRNKHLISEKIPGENPLINIQITFDRIPCFAQDPSNQKIKDSSYKLSVIKENECNKYGRDHQETTRLDSQTAYETYTQNSFPKTTMGLPGFQKSAKNTIAILSSTTRMKTAKNDYCLDIDVKTTEDFIKALDSFSNFMNALLPPIIVGLQFFAMGSVICHLIDESREANYRNSRMYERMLKFYFWIHFITCFFMIGEFGWYYNVYQPFGIIKEEIKKYDLLRCFAGSQGSLVISDYLEIIRRMEEGFWANFGIMILSVLNVLVLVGFYFVKKIPLKR